MSFSSFLLHFIFVSLKKNIALFLRFSILNFTWCVMLLLLLHTFLSAFVPGFSPLPFPHPIPVGFTLWRCQLYIDTTNDLRIEESIEKRYLFLLRAYVRLRDRRWRLPARILRRTLTRAMTRDWNVTKGDRWASQLFICFTFLAILGIITVSLALHTSWS